MRRVSARLIEYARNVCGLVEADHEETAPGVAHLLISRICPLIETDDEILVAEGTLLRSIYGQPRIVEGYHCSYGLSREYESALFADGLHPAAHDAAGEVRAVELRPHPFFVATLFQPERRALLGKMPPLAATFLRAWSRPARNDTSPRLLAGPETSCRLSCSGLFGMLRGYVQRVAFVLIAPSEVKVRAMPSRRIGVAGAGGFAAGTGCGRQTALDHGLGGDGKLLEKFCPGHPTT